MTAALQGKLHGTGPGFLRVWSVRLKGPTQATLAIMGQGSRQNFYSLPHGGHFLPLFSVGSSRLLLHSSLLLLFPEALACVSSHVKSALGPFGTMGKDVGGRRR